MSRDIVLEGRLNRNAVHRARRKNRFRRMMDYLVEQATVWCVLEEEYPRNGVGRAGRPEQMCGKPTFAH